MAFILTFRLPEHHHSDGAPTFHSSTLLKPPRVRSHTRNSHTNTLTRARTRTGARPHRSAEMNAARTARTHGWKIFVFAPFVPKVKPNDGGVGAEERKSPMENRAAPYKVTNRDPQGTDVIENFNIADLSTWAAITAISFPLGYAVGALFRRDDAEDEGGAGRDRGGRGGVRAGGGCRLSWCTRWLWCNVGFGRCRPRIVIPFPVRHVVAACDCDA